MEKQLSYPKHKIKVLLLEGIHANAEEVFNSDGFEAQRLDTALSENDLIEAIQGVHVLGIRSKTQLSSKVIQNADKLLAIGAFCIGTNQIDLEACSSKGVAVFNAPFSNTRSVVELALGEMIMLIRNIFPRSNELHKGIWNKTAKNSYELRGKVLGIIGYGHIGSQLSVLAESMGMQVLYYDIEDRMPLGNAESVADLNILLQQSDIVSLHVDGRVENKDFMGEAEFSSMKQGAYFLNLSRGNVVDYQALKNYIDSGKIAGTAIDVYPREPKSNKESFVSNLQGLKNVILTPHIGGSTEEAQVAISSFVPEKILQYINNGTSTGSVNMPIVQLPVQRDQHRILHIHKNVSGVLAKINEVIAENKVNISGQYLKTTEDLGYVVIDIEGKYPNGFIKELKNTEYTIKSRILY